MSSVVLDSSALLAAILGEPGAERVEAHLTSASMSAVNLSEVAAKAVERGYQLDGVIAELSRLSIEYVPFDADLAYVAASLRLATRHIGLSLGDRACLALGLKTGLPVLTADRAWASVDLGVNVDIIR